MNQSPNSVPLNQFVPTKRRKLADDLYAQLLTQLSDSTYQIGAKLPTEQQLASAFGVSRPIVREALQRLQDDGIVSSRRGAGTFVNRVPPAEVGSLMPRGDFANYMRAFEVRSCLEPEACRLAARRRTPSSIAALAETLRTFDRVLTSGEASSQADFDFHLQIARTTENDLFVSQMVALRPTLLGTINITSGITRARPIERRQKVMSEHNDIFRAIEAGEEDRAHAYMMYHLMEVRGRITDASR